MTQHPMIRWLRFGVLGVGLMAVAFILVAPAQPSQAGLDGRCTASGDFVNGTKADGSFTLDAKEVGSQTIVIPRADTVNWSGAVDVPASPRAYSGSISVKLPPPFGEVTIHDWKGNSDRVSNSGVEDYKLPSLVPAGVTFTVSGQHVEAAATCSGTVNVKIEGGVFDSPVAPISLGLTAATGAGFLAALRPLFRKVV
jgi:hypothetical protein